MLSRYVRVVTPLVMCLFLSSCMGYGSLQSINKKARSWDQSERTGLPNGDKLISQHLDSKQGETFYLYYFTTELPPKPQDNNYKDKTILFCSGGPGQNVRNLSENDRNAKASPNFVDLPGYRVVYFHLRGSGFSQIPDSNVYDRYLRTRYAVKDVEKIREDLGLEKWHAVVGHSYGTVLAQQYAHDHPDRLNKLILSAPMSRHQFKTSASTSTKDKVLREMRQKNLDSLRMIYSRRDFHVFFSLFSDDPKDSERLIDLVVEEVGEKLTDVDNVFGSLPALIDFHEELNATYKTVNPAENKIKYKNLLDYSVEFFKALRRIRFVGWIPQANQDLQWGIGSLIADEVLRVRNIIAVEERLKGHLLSKGKLLKPDLVLTSGSKTLCELLPEIASFADVGKIMKTQGFVVTPEQKDTIEQINLVFPLLNKGLCTMRGGLVGGSSEAAKRVFYVMTVYDGLDIDFLEKWTYEGYLDSESIPMDDRSLPTNKYLRKIGITLGEEPRPWDPADFRHNKPTLILKGGADSVSVGQAAEYIYEKALASPEKILIELPGVGHDMTLPVTLLRDVSVNQFAAWKGCQVEGSAINDVRTCLLDIFMSDRFENDSWGKLLQLIEQQLHCNVKVEMLTDEEIRIIVNSQQSTTRIGNCGSL
jgi:pimeloyl-ACP methyl ester carboxylesterase